jgi:glycosyltransferase involved in cell wall biosynthesis
MTSAPPASRSKVIFVNRYFSPDESATSQILSYLAFGLARRGFSIHVLCSRQRYDQALADLKAFEIIDAVTVHRVWTTRFGRDRLVGRALDYLSFYLSSAWFLLKMLNRGDTVVAKTDPPLVSIVAMVAAKAKGARLINWLQDIFPEVATHLGYNPLPRSADAFVRRLRDSTLRDADMNIVLGGRMREFLERLGIPAAKIGVVENWADNDGGICGGAAGTALRARLGLAGKFVVGYSGNLGRAHDFRTLLDAATLLGADKDISFLMIGGGVGMTALKHSVEQRGMCNFKFLPYQPRTTLADSLAAADVHWLSLLPALEGLIVPSKLYGILAAGRPVIFIGDPDGEVARLIGPTKAGVTVAVGDAKDLVRQIAELKLDPGRREAMGRNGYGLYRDQFRPHRALARWCDILATPAPVVPLESPSSNTSV